MSAYLKPGPKNLITDVAGLRVGNAHDDALKSGVTVLCADAPFVAAVDVMGGAPGTRETDLLAPDRLVEAVDALVLSGGSAFGLDAASGVVDALRDDGRGFQVGDQAVPLVPAAIIFDLLNGGQKSWTENPYRKLGAQAYQSASSVFDLGSVGAGTGATTANLKGGLGSASFVTTEGITVGALVAANPIGSVIRPNSRHFWAAPFEVDAEFGGLGAEPDALNFETALPLKSDASNTTIAIVATDALLSKAQAKRVAVAAQDGIGRAVVPSHTPFDGDLVFAAATGKVALTDEPRQVMEIGNAGAMALSRAIARAIYSASPARDDVVGCWSDLA